MSAQPPIVSIGLPIYNEEHYLRGTLDSLLAQQFKDFELIISDNASTDSTREICLEYAAKDSRIQYCRNEANVGPTENFNRAFRSASGKYMWWAGGHDLWAPSFLARCVDVLEMEPAVVLCYPQSVLIDAEGKELFLTDSRTDTRNRGVLYRFNLAVCAVGCAWAFCGVIRSGALRRTRLIKPVIESDLVLLTELALQGPFANVPEVLFYPRNKWGDSPDTRRKRWKRYFNMLDTDGTNRRVWFPYLAWIREGLLGVKHAPLNPVLKLILMACVFVGYLSRYRVYLPRGLRLGVRTLMNRALGAQV